MPALEQYAARYTSVFLSLLPPGEGLTKQPGTNTHQAAEAFCEETARARVRADELRDEMVPWRATELLTEWEDALGIAEEADAVSRRAAILAHLLGGGPPTEPGWSAIAAQLGYALSFKRDPGFRAGLSRCGDRCGVTQSFRVTVCYTSGGSDDALLEQLLQSYGGDFSGGVLLLEALAAGPITIDGAPLTIDGEQVTI